MKGFFAAEMVPAVGNGGRGVDFSAGTGVGSAVFSVPCAGEECHGYTAVTGAGEIVRAGEPTGALQVVVLPVGNQATGPYH